MKEPLLEPILRYFRIRSTLSHIPKYSVILDIGCGRSATFLKAISTHIKQGVGIDFKVNQNLNITNIKTVQVRLDNDLPFEDYSFDVVTMLAVLEHIENEKEILSEIYRVLVPGGKLIITVPSIWAQPVLELLAYRLKIVSEEEIRDHKRYYTKKSLNNLLKEIGFTQFNHRYFQFWMNNFCTVIKRK